jgi:hypothetical protein
MKTVVTILTSIIGIAILATLISGKSNTVGVIEKLTSSFANLIKTALSANK